MNLLYKNILYIFYAELLLSLASVVQTLFMPEVFLVPFNTGQASALSIEITRWYGVVLTVLLYLLARGLWLRGPTLKVALEAMLLGDFVQIYVAFGTAQALGGWAPNVQLSVFVSLLLAAARAFCLWKPVETGVLRG